MRFVQRFEARRLAAFGLVLLVLYFVANSFYQAQQNGDAIEQTRIASQQLIDSNKRLVELTAQLEEERAILVRLNAAQSQRIRELGGDPVDVFDPEVSGTNPEGARRVQVLIEQEPIGRTPTAAPERRSEPSARSPRPRPSPSRSQPSVTLPVPVPEPVPSRIPLPAPLPMPVPVPSLSLVPTLTPIPVPVPSLSSTPSAELSQASTLRTEESVDTVNFFNLDAATASRALGLLIPLLVALLTKRVASSRTKAVLNIVASALAGSAAYLVAADGGYDVEGFVNAALNTIIVSVATYYGLYKPTGITDTVQNKTANFGIGRKPELETDDKVQISTIQASSVNEGTIGSDPYRNDGV